ncbi:MAG: DUF4845 domain-containing protein [Pseudomonadota bacterium]|jgi:hypothetical protein
MRGYKTRSVRGVSLVSTLFVLVIFGLFVYIGGRLVPVYLEYRGVVQTLDAVAASGSGDIAAVRVFITRGFDSAGVHTLEPNDVEVTRQDGQLSVTVDYDAVAPFIGNVGFVVHFHKAAIISGPAQP